MPYACCFLDRPVLVREFGVGGQAGRLSDHHCPRRHGQGLVIQNGHVQVQQGLWHLTAQVEILVALLLVHTQRDQLLHKLGFLLTKQRAKQSIRHPAAGGIESKPQRCDTSHCELRNLVGNGAVGQVAVDHIIVC